MTMVDMTFHRQYHNVILLADLGCELLEPGFKPIYQKELSPIARAKYKVIVYHRNSGLCASVSFQQKSSRLVPGTDNVSGTFSESLPVLPGAVRGISK